MTNILKNKANKKNSGFTLVELIVVLALTAILLALVIFGGLAWQDWTKFKHEDSAAEDIFYAFQNQLTELDNGGTLQKTISDALKDDETGEYQSKYILAYSKAEQVTERIGLNSISNSDGIQYSWDNIWYVQENLSGYSGTNSNKNKEDRTILTLSAEADQYSIYLTEKNNPSTSLDPGTILLFDLVSPYLSDTSVLNGAIVVEFSPEAAQVFSVCYTDKNDKLAYEESPANGVGILDRSENTRRKNMIGYYSAEKLYESIKGRSVMPAHISLEVHNEEIMYLKLVDEAITNAEKINENDKLDFIIYNGDNPNGTNSAMKFTIDCEDVLKNGAPQDLDNAIRRPQTIVVTTYYGLWNNNSLEYRVPVYYKTNISGNIEIYIVLDGADVQAGTAAYLGCDFTNPDSASAKALRNTFSFYRFGLKDSLKYLYASVELTGSERGTTEKIYSVRKNGNKKINHEKEKTDGNFYGECATFATYTAAGSNSKAVRTITNGRHFYNMRYETECKVAGSEDTSFILAGNIDWNEFTGQAEGFNQNYFLNSFDSTKSSSNVTAGIDYSGKSIITGGDGNTGNVDTKDFPFPGYRCLGKGDEFKQDEGNEFIISNITLSFAANILYGVYDDVLKGEANNAVYGGSQDLRESVKAEACKKNANLSSILGMTDATNTILDSGKYSSKAKLTRGGTMPLGLFAENLGSISNIILENHTVRGIEKDYTPLDNTVDSVVATNMVGGFVGNNLGSLENLTLRSGSVSGRTDVGGIVGRESFVVTDAETNAATKEVSLNKLENYATVSGLENIGGIVGRAYTHYTGEDGIENFDVVATDRVRFLHDRYFITDTNKSMTGANVARAKKVLIVSCKNHGLISGDTVFSGKKTDSNKDAKCAFIGGIAGVAMDGFMFEVQGATSQATALDYYSSQGYFKGTFSYMSITNCSSYMEGSTPTVPNHDNDYFVGGLVGYARFTTFENCNETPENYNSEIAPGYYVTGKRYVGGIAGCSDLCLFKKGTNQTYAVTNYNNVIGERYVGGISGAFAIGDNSQQNLSFWNPSTAEAGEPSQYKIFNKNNYYNIIENWDRILNTGVVLGKNESKAYAMDTPKTNGLVNANGAVGGVVGVLRAPLQKADNIQPVAVKRLAMDLVTGLPNSNLYEMNINDIATLTSSSIYGGNGVGGIVGYAMGYAWVNYNTDDSCRVDAIVYGQDYVGGAIGYTLRETDLDSVKNVTPVNNGMLVVGRDSVGGLFGCHMMNSANGQFDTVLSVNNSKYTVRGRYAVGGVSGYLVSNRKIQATISGPAKTESADNRIKVDGIAYVGGVSGIVSSAINQNTQIQLSNMVISGKYFAGGIYGAIAVGQSGAQKIEEITSGRVTASETVDVNAEIFAGGIAGVYTKTNGALGTSSQLYKIANNTLYTNTKKYNYDEAYAIALNCSHWKDDGTQPDIKFPVNSNNTLAANVTANVYAGGLFGFVPDGTTVQISNYVNKSRIETTETVTGVGESSDQSAKYSYLGGVTGRVSKGMILDNCSNLMAWYDLGTNESHNWQCLYKPDSDSSFLGGLAEVNAGKIQNCTNNTNYIYSNFNGTISPFVGVNGVLNDNPAIIEKCTNGSDNSSDSVQIVSAGSAAGITGVADGLSQISNCTNYGTIVAWLNKQSGTAAGIVAVSKNNDNTDKKMVHNVFSCTNKGKVTGYINAAGVLGYAESSAISRTEKNDNNQDVIVYVNNITECVNYGVISNTENEPSEDSRAMATGITVDAGRANVGKENETPNGSITYCSSFGALIGKQQHGITCNSTAVLMGNLVAISGFTGEDGNHPLAPDDRYSDNHVRNFYISGYSSDAAQDETVERYTLNINENFTNISDMLRAQGIDSDEELAELLNYQYAYSQYWSSEQYCIIFDQKKETLIKNKIGMDASKPDAFMSYIALKYFPGDFPEPDKDFINYYKILFCFYLRDYKKVSPNDFDEDDFLKYAKKVIATANLSPGDFTPPTIEIDVAKNASQADDNIETNQEIVELKEELKPWHGYITYNAQKITQSFVNNCDTGEPEIAYFYREEFGNDFTKFGEFLANIYCQACLDYNWTPTGKTEEETDAFFNNQFLPYLRETIKNGKVSGSSSSAGTDNSHWPVRLYVANEGNGTYKLQYKRLVLHDSKIPAINGYNATAADSVTAINSSFATLNDEFVKMAKNENNTYPQNFTPAGQEEKGFVLEGSVGAKSLMSVPVGSRVFANAGEATQLVEEAEKIIAAQEEKKKLEEEKKKAEEERKAQEKKQAEDKKKVEEEKQAEEDIKDKTDENVNSDSDTVGPEGADTDNEDAQNIEDSNKTDQMTNGDESEDNKDDASSENNTANDTTTDPNAIPQATDGISDGDLQQDNQTDDENFETPDANVVTPVTESNMPEEETNSGSDDGETGNA